MMSGSTYSTAESRARRAATALASDIGSGVSSATSVVSPAIARTDFMPTPAVAAAPAAGPAASTLRNPRASVNQLPEPQCQAGTGT